MIRYRHLILWPEHYPGDGFSCEITNANGETVHVMSDNEPTQAAAIRAAREWIDAHSKAQLEAVPS